MEAQQAPGFGPAQKEKLAEVLAEIKGLHFSRGDSPDAFILTVRNLVAQLKVLAPTVLPTTFSAKLNWIEVDDYFASANEAKAELDALVPAVEDALALIDSQPSTHLSASLEQLLEDRNLDTVSEEVERALQAAESDPPVAITAARAALESLLKVYIEDRGLTSPSRPKPGKLLKTAMGDLGLDPADKTDTDVRGVLQGLWSVVHGIADLRTRAGSAHGYGRNAYRLQARHARLAVQASQAFIEFFIETWNYREGRSSSDSQFTAKAIIGHPRLGPFVCLLHWSFEGTFSQTSAILESTP